MNSARNRLGVDIGPFRLVLGLLLDDVTLDLSSSVTPRRPPRQSDTVLGDTVRLRRFRRVRLNCKINTK